MVAVAGEATSEYADSMVRTIDEAPMEPRTHFRWLHAVLVGLCAIGAGGSTAAHAQSNNVSPPGLNWRVEFPVSIGDAYRLGTRANPRAPNVAARRARMNVAPQPVAARRRGVGRMILGGVIGGVGGFFAGGYLGAAIEGDGCGCDDPGLKGALIGAPIGAAAGAILGARFLF
jgi:hypothetical protein